jgi:hypothetical protein
MSETDTAPTLLTADAQQAGGELVQDLLSAASHAPQSVDDVLLCVSIDAATGLLPDGTPASATELEKIGVWKELFEKSGKRMVKCAFGFAHDCLWAADGTIGTVHAFTNLRLEERFDRARAKLEELGRPHEELHLFHGTSEVNFDSYVTLSPTSIIILTKARSILKSGLHVGGTNGIEIGIGCASGVGIYLTDEAHGALGYTYGANRIFGCRVMPGKVTHDVEKVRRIPHTELGREKYDCYVGPYGKMQLYVVRCADLVLPCYVSSQAAFIMREQHILMTTDD